MRILSVATEWFSSHGGLSTLNRELCVALSRLGHDVHCFVPSARSDERNHARMDGVNLIGARNIAGMAEHSRLLIPPEFPDSSQPEIIIGHGRVTGPAAAVLSQYHFPQSRLIHFIHVYPGDIASLEN
jgi:glycosyltransferase involved in cell wall biosynthesis